MTIEVTPAEPAGPGESARGARGGPQPPPVQGAVSSALASGGVQLEARLASPPGARAGVVICHPHPLYGGDMENPVVMRVRDVCETVGLATLRFNFRGVGRSTGTHGEGVGEERDLNAAMAALAEQASLGSAVAVAGYSFGAVIAARVAAATGTAAAGERAAMAGLLMVAPPLKFPGLAAPRWRATSLTPVMIVGGTRDEYCPPDALQALGDAIPGAMVRTIEGADHFFFGKLYPLGEIVLEWARQLVRGG